MAELPITQATIIVRDDEGNAFAAGAETPKDANGDRVLAYLRYELQDNRVGWCEVYKERANGSIEGIARVEVRVPEGLQKPDDVTISVSGDTPRVLVTAHQTSLTGQGESAEDVQGRIITIAYAEFPGLFVPLPTSPGPPAEPPIVCVPPLNRPYFRPNRPVTRAQLSKIVSIALGLPAPVAGTQTFEDVPEGSTFHEYIEALYGIGAVNGYPCTEED